MFEQTVKNVEPIQRDIEGFDNMSVDDLRDLCRKAWEEDFSSLFLIDLKKEDVGKYNVQTESKNLYT